MSTLLGFIHLFSLCFSRKMHGKIRAAIVPFILGAFITHMYMYVVKHQMNVEDVVRISPTESDQKAKQQADLQSLKSVPLKTDLQSSKAAGPNSMSVLNPKSAPDLPGLNVLIFTAYRSGSSFVGEFFNQNPEFLYLFEPLKMMDISNNTWTERHQAIQKTLLPVLRDLFQCKFGPLQTYAYSNQPTGPQQKEELRFWRWKVFKILYDNMNISHYKNAYKTSISDLSIDCKKYQHRAIKIIRGETLSSVWELIYNENTSNSHNRILYLVRDPRGVMASRHKVEAKKKKLDNWKMFQNTDRNILVHGAKNTCDKYTNNIRFLESMNSTYNFKLIRYEDIAYNPVSMATKIYKFLRIPLPDNVLSWIHKATRQTTSNEQDLDVYSTMRDSSRSAEGWRKYIPYEIAAAMDTQCAEALRLLGYSTVSDLDVYSNTSYVKKLELKYGLA